MSDFIGIGIVGVLVSLAIETIQRYAGTDSLKTKWLTVFTACVVGGLYAWLRATAYFEAILGVLAGASTVYAFIFKK
jgi:hypothetical protein